jgi:methylene-tetrahydromethanopterin dehydrogenase
VELGEVTGLIQDAIFSRGPKGAKRTGAFIGGKSADLALDMFEQAKTAMFPPFQISLFVDPAGSFTTAAAMVACVEKLLKDRFQSGLSGRKVMVFGATGIVGFASGVLAGQQGADVTLVGHDGPNRVRAGSEKAKDRFGVDLAFADGSTDALKSALVAQSEVVLAAGRAGVQIVSALQLAGAEHLMVAADVNAVPPAGIESVHANDNGKQIAGTEAVGLGALAIGNVKYQVELRLFRRMIEAEKAVFLSFPEAFQLARELVG